MFREPYGERVSVALKCGEGRTHQSFKDECDINKLMRKWEKNRILSHVNTHQGEYGDFTNAPQDYHAAMGQVIAAQAAFMSLPANVRKRFDNDPGSFLQFVGDPANENEMRELGILERKVAPGPVAPSEAAPAVAPSEAAPAASQEGSGGA